MILSRGFERRRIGLSLRSLSLMHDRAEAKGRGRRDVLPVGNGRLSICPLAPLDRMPWLAAVTVESGTASDTPRRTLTDDVGSACPSTLRLERLADHACTDSELPEQAHRESSSHFCHAEEQVVSGDEPVSGDGLNPPSDLRKVDAHAAKRLLIAVPKWLLG